LRMIGLTQQKTWHGEADVFSVFGFAETLPLGILRTLEDGVQLLEVWQPFEGIQPEELSTGRRHKGRMGHGRNRRTVLQHPDIDRIGAEIVVPNNCPNRLATELAVLRRVDQLVEARFGDVWRVL